MAKVKVQPGAGRIVRLAPGAKPIKAEGVTIERTLLVEKWIANGDLVPVAEPQEVPVAEPQVVPVAEPQGVKVPDAPSAEKGVKS